MFSQRMQFIGNGIELISYVLEALEDISVLLSEL